ncbi:hypothetical protein [Candidatus Methylacidithermus pantelleriae]|uniref:Uncharacterized protein n=1 Tax=Candidatus Methylacidithermus pantelleriae TaxID=2744239 RepID=A0A8J2FRP8_9BACT|nr:hypothetical protein [Candidatus Methylacidithermus pantelleriae]CAF0700303.1 hypothetical protein MPNT_350005 [Candidatus Methylacidithermus pantelleriae]
MAEETHIDLKTEEGKAAFVDVALSEPETRPHFLKLFKKLFPKSVVPEIDAKEAAMQEIQPVLEELKKENEELKTKLGSVVKENHRITQWHEYRQKGYSDNVILEAEKLVAEGKVADMDTALELTSLKNRPPETEPPGRWLRYKEEPAIDLQEIQKLGSKKLMMRAAKEAAKKEFDEVRRKVLGR